MRRRRALPVLTALRMTAPALARRFAPITPDARPGAGLTSVDLRLGDRLMLRERDRHRTGQAP